MREVLLLGPGIVGLPIPGLPAMLEVRVRLCEAKSYEVPAVLDGVPVTVQLRVYVEDGKALALRSANVIIGNRRLPSIDVGKARWDELEALMERDHCGTSADPQGPPESSDS